jgi:drug/metabolite transporter (DMT)-like permease
MDHAWIYLALLSAFSLATSDALTKKALSCHNEYLIAWLRLLWSLPLVCVPLAIAPMPRVDSGFALTFAIALPLEVCALILYVKALKTSPLSLTIPFLALTPLFLIVLPHLLLGETVSLPAGLGVVLIAVGGYTLNLNDLAKGPLGPFRAILSERGALYMILVAVIYAVTSTLGKRAIEQSSALFFGATYFAALTIVLAPLAVLKARRETGTLLPLGALKASALPGLAYGAMILSHMLALSLTKVAYMISVKRLSLLIAVLYGYLFFRETGFAQRFFGAALMFSGFVLIVLYH